MKFTTTLAILREHQPCPERWGKLLRHLGKDYPTDKPIDFSTIIESNGLEDALWGLRGVMPEQEKDRDRLARLFACECAEAIISNFEKEYPEDKRPREALICARQFANGERSSAEMGAARSAAWSAASSAASSAARSAAEAAQKQLFIEYFCTPKSRGGRA